MKSYQELANQLIRQGDEARTSGRSEEAIRCYRRAMDLVPGYNSLQLVIADMLFEDRDYAASEKAYEEVLASFPEHDQAWEGLGRCRLLREDYAGAEEAFSRALEAAPAAPEASYYLALLKARAGDQKSAAAMLATALSQRPTWESRAREEPLLAPLFDLPALQRLSREKRWWEFWR